MPAVPTSIQQKGPLEALCSQTVNGSDDWWRSLYVDVRTSREAAGRSTGRDLLSRLVEAVNTPFSQVTDCDVALGEHPTHAMIPVKSPKALADCSDWGPWDASLVNRWVVRTGILHHGTDNRDHESWP